MRIKPILFNTEMVQAILSGRKTQTRRAIKDGDVVNGFDCEADGTPIAFIDRATGSVLPPTSPCPYQPGDILYVRETWKQALPRCAESDPYFYKADEAQHTNGANAKAPWRPSIHMPKEAARIFLRVTNVRVERLQNITDDDAFAEGAQTTASFQNARFVFRDIWNKTLSNKNKHAFSWNANPYVWVIEFERYPINTPFCRCRQNAPSISQRRNPMITVYSTPACGKCAIVKNLLKQQRIDFEEVDYASLDEQAQQNILRAAEEAGQKSFPILFQDCAIVQLEDILK